MRWDFSTARRRAFLTSEPHHHAARTEGVGKLRAVLSLLDLTFLGLGSIIGAGVYVLSGVTSKEVAGPSIILSYITASGAAVLAALSYAEFATAMPVAGGAFNYIKATFGELAAWTVGWNMILETLLSSSAVSRGFSGYLATLLGLSADAFLIKLGSLQCDPLAVILICLLTAVLATGTRESSTFNIAVCSCNLACITFVLLVGLPLGDTGNLTPFFPYGMQGTFAGASILFFAFVGFDFLANAAEEVTNPSRNLPIGILTSLGIATLLYSLMALDITMLVPYSSIDVHAPFSAVFASKGMIVVSKLISAGALAGIITSTMTGMLSQARLLVVLGRSALLPKKLANVRKGNGTPMIATVVTGMAASCLALFLDISTLAELVSVGTLYVFCTVCAAVVYRRCHIHGEGSPTPVIWRLAASILTGAGASSSYTLGGALYVTLSFLFLWVISVIGLYTLPVVRPPPKFSTPLFPFLPALGMLSTLHLLCSLGWPAYVRFALWMVIGIAVYFFFGASAAELEENKHTAHLEEKAPLHRKQSEIPALPMPYSSDLDTINTHEEIQLVHRNLTSLEPEGLVKVSGDSNDSQSSLHDRQLNHI